MPARVVPRPPSGVDSTGRRASASAAGVTPGSGRRARARAQRGVQLLRVRVLEDVVHQRAEHRAAGQVGQRRRHALRRRRPGRADGRLVGLVVLHREIGLGPQRRFVRGRRQRAVRGAPPVVVQGPGERGSRERLARRPRPAPRRRRARGDGVDLDQAARPARQLVEAADHVVVPGRGHAGRRHRTRPLAPEQQPVQRAARGVAARRPVRHHLALRAGQRDVEQPQLLPRLLLPMRGPATRGRWDRSCRRRRARGSRRRRAAAGSPGGPATSSPSRTARTPPGTPGPC